MRNLLSLFLFFLFTNMFSQQTQTVDFKHVSAVVSLKPETKSVSGTVAYEFEMLRDADSIYLNAKDMEFSMENSGPGIELRPTADTLWLVYPFKADKTYDIQFSYTAKPEQTLYFVGWENKGSNQIWTQGQGQKTSYWLPSFDDPNEKVEFDLSINFKKGYEVIANGKLIDKSKVNDSIMKWEFDMRHPMSSYLVAVAVGNYDRKAIASAAGVPIYLYYYPEKEGLVEPTYRYSKEIFDFLVKTIGVAYPWQNYKQVPVRDFLYSGMENTGTTIFSDIFLTDSIGFKDRNYVMVNAHELAHQWFGDMVTAASSKHHWLQEGFATYYALLAEKEIFGNEYFYWKLYESAERLRKQSDAGKGEAVISIGSNSFTYYQKGAWALHILREKIGADAFSEGIKNYLKKYKYANVTTHDFIAEMEKASGMDLSLFVSKWLEQSAFQAYEALKSLKRSPFIQDYMEVAALKKIPLEGKKELLNQALDFPVNDYIGQEVVYQLALENPTEVLSLYKKAFATNNIYVRQAIAASMDSIPPELKMEYESLLEDESYLTKEIAFYNLWMNFPESRIQYLEKLKGVKGFSDKNIRILWLALNLATPTYNPENKQQVYNELSGYTASNYPFYIRENAFRYLFQLHAFNDENLKDLLAATQHHTSRFRNFSRDMVRKLLENEEYGLRFLEIMRNLPVKQQKFLKKEITDFEDTVPSK